MFPASLFLKGKAALNGSEAEQRLATILLDEAVQVLSSFELNQMASLTYNGETCEQIFDMLEEVMAHPLDHSVLCLQKSLVITKHVLIYGSEKCVNSTWALGRHVNVLQEYNTVLLSQQRNGADTWWHRVKGGGVDKGFAVREAAKDLHTLLQSTEQIQVLRHTKADPNSLVPIGDDRVAFVSDEVRLYILKKRMEEQQLIRTKSNLTMAKGGFGSGYQGKDGKTVVGAAHSVEEMIARAQREKNRYTDDGPPPEQEDQYSSMFRTPAVTTSDLLDYENPQGPAAPVLDLLDFSSESVSLQSAPVDLLGAGGVDLLGNTTSSGPDINGAAQLLDLMTMTPVATKQEPIAGSGVEKYAFEYGSSTLKPSVLSSNADRFAALDALSSVGVSSSSSILPGLEAQNRILGSLGSSIPSSGKDVNAFSDIMSSFGRQSVDVTPLGLGGLVPPPPSVPPPPLPPPPVPVSPPPVPPLMMPHAPHEDPDYSAITMGVSFGDSIEHDEVDNAFFMGGVSGSGLQPTGAAPAAAPPPPPPPSW